MSEPRHIRVAIDKNWPTFKALKLNCATNISSKRIIDPISEIAINYWMEFIVDLSAHGFITDIRRGVTRIYTRRRKVNKPSRD